MKIVRHGNTCILKQASSSKQVEAEVFEFKDHDKLTVVVNKNIKVFLKWNGKLYEGKMAGLDFVSSGPDTTTSTTGR